MRRGDRGRARGIIPWRAWSAVGFLVLVAALGVGLTLHIHAAGLAPRTPAAPAVDAAPLAPDFTLPVAASAGLPAARGGHLSLHALRGHPILLAFVQSACGACLDELPLLDEAARRYRPQGLVVLGIAAFGDGVASARRLAAAAHMTVPLVVDDQALAWQYGVSDAPTSLFVDAQGRLIGQHIGPLDGQTIRDGLAQAGAIACAACGALEPLSIDAAPAAGAAFSADFTFAPPRAAPWFALRDQRGRVVSPRSRGHGVVALTFISALCREQCPLIGMTLSRVSRQLGADASRLSIVAISVDPEVDALAATRAFAAESGWQGLDWHYLTAPRATLARVWAAYGIDVPRPSPIFKVGQTIVHQAGLYLLDGQGRLRAYYDTPFFAPRVAATVRALLAPS